MGIWKQRIDESWLKCSGTTAFKVINANGGTSPSANVTAISLKHNKIDSNTGTIYKYLPTDLSFTPEKLTGFMASNIGTNTLLGSGVYSYILDYYFTDISSTKKFTAIKNYQFKTHVYNFAYANNRTVVEPYLNISTNSQLNQKLYNSSLNIFKGALGINPTWEDSYYFDVPYYNNFLRAEPKQPTMYILYYYSSPKVDTDSGFVAFTNKLTSSKNAVTDATGNPISYDFGITKSPTQSVYHAGYGIGGLEINETGWKIQGYSFVSYDNDPYLGDYSTLNAGTTNYYSGLLDASGKYLPNKQPLKRCVFGKGWYYDDENNEYTWYDQQYSTAASDLNDNNNPVGGDAGFQESHFGYRENNYIAKYIPFQKFNLSFLYECLRTDSGIKIYLSPTLPSSKSSESSIYKGILRFPDTYYLSSYPATTAEVQLYTNANSGAGSRGLSLVMGKYQVPYTIDPVTLANISVGGIQTAGGLPRDTNNTGVTYFPYAQTNDVYAPTVATGSFTGANSAQSYNNFPTAYINVNSTGPIKVGSIVTLSFTSQYSSYSTQYTFNRSYTILGDNGDDWLNFKAAFDGEIVPKQGLFKSQSHPDRVYTVTCSGITLSVKGTEKGTNSGTLWGNVLFPRYGRVSASITVKVPSEASRSTIIKDYTGNDPNKALVNNIFVDDDSTNLKEIKVNITLRHTYVADMIINLRVPNGNVINLKAKYSGGFFNDLRNITFTTNTNFPKMQGLNFWPNGKNKGYVYDPIGLPANPSQGYPATGLSYPVKAPWLPTGYNNFSQSASGYNFDWSQLMILPGLTFQMDKNNGLGTTTTVNGFNNILETDDETVDFRSSVNDLKYLSNPDGTFLGTYSLYIKDDWGGDSGLFEAWSIEFIYKKVYTPILTLTQSDVANSTNPGAAKLQYLFGLEGNQYLFIVGDKVPKINDIINITSGSTTANLTLSNLSASLKNLKIDGGYHGANNRMYRVNDDLFGVDSNNPSVDGVGGDNTFELLSNIENVSYSTYVGTGNLNNPNTLSLSSVTAKIGNGKFISGLWENGAWNSGWRKDENLHEFYNISDFFSYNRDKRWRFSISGSMDAVSNFEVGDKISIGNIVAIDVNEERKLIKSYFTIMTKTTTSIAVEFESDFPIRRIKIDSNIHRIYITKNVWLTGGFFNGYFTGIWNNGLFKGFPYITEMFDSHWVDGKLDGGHFQSKKRSVDFSNTYLATLDRIKVGIIFDEIHKLTIGDTITISSTFSTFGSTTILSVPDDYRIIVDMDWSTAKDPNTYGTAIKGTITTNISTGLVQNLDFNANNVSKVTSLQSMDNTRVFMYDSWMDVNFDNTSGVNIGKPQSTINNSVSTYAYSDNNLYGYPTYDVLSSSVTFRDSFSNTVRKYRLGSKYKIYEDYIGDAGDFGEHFDVTGWTTRAGAYRTNTFPYYQIKPLGQELPKSTEFANQGWVFSKDGNPGAAISFERTTEAVDDEDPAAGKEMKVSAVGKGGVLNIQPSYDVANRTNSTIAKQRYTIIKFDLIQALVPDFIFEESNTTVYDDSSKYQPIIHFNNLNYALRKVFIPGTGFRERKLDTTYFPVYKNVNHVSTPNKSKIEYFYNKTNLSMFFRGNGLDGKNVSNIVVDNLKLYEVDMIPFFQYFNTRNINKSVSVPYQAVAPNIEYVENDFSLLDNSIYGLDSFYIYQPSGEVSIQAESAAAAAEAAASDPVVLASTVPSTAGPDPWHAQNAQNAQGYTPFTS